MTTLRQLTNEDLRWELDRSLENGNQRREQSVLREMERREMTSSV